MWFSEKVTSSKGSFWKTGSHQKGFTLLEVLLAMIIVGIFLTAAAGLFSGSLKMAGKAGDYTLLSYLADSKLNQAFLILKDKDSDSNNFDGDFSQYRWQLEKKELSVPDFDDEKIKAAPGLYQVEVTITWTDGDRERNFRLFSYQSALVKEPEDS